MEVGDAVMTGLTPARSPARNPAGHCRPGHSASLCGWYA